MPKPSVKSKVSKAKKFDRNALKSGLTDRVKESYEKRDSFGSTTGIFDPSVKFNRWMPKIGDHLLDIVPYVVGTKDPKLTEGSVTYFTEIWVHYGVGPNEGSFVCLTKNYNKKCPICEHQKELRLKGASDEEIKALYPKRRVMYNIICRDTIEEENKGVQVWEVSHFHAEKHFSELARKPKGGGFIPFTDPDNGKMIFFNKISKMEVTGHRFVERDNPITDEELESAYTLDELIHIPSYEEVYEAFYGETIEEEKPKKVKHEPEPEDEPEDGEDWEEEPEDEEPEPAPKKKGKKKPEPEPDDESEESDWDEEPEPAPKKKSKKKQPEPEPEEEDEEDDDWDDE